MRNVLAHAGKGGRRVAAAFSATAFAGLGAKGQSFGGAVLLERHDEWAVQCARDMTLKCIALLGDGETGLAVRRARMTTLARLRETKMIGLPNPTPPSGTRTLYATNSALISPGLS